MEKNKAFKYPFLFWLVPIVWLLAVTVPHLEQGGFRTDTGRYAAVGLQMWDKGDLLYSYTQPESPYFRKPPLGFWIHGGFLKGLGVNLVIARAPSILAAMGTLLLLFWLVKNYTANRLWAFGAAFVLAITYEFTRRTREISLDHWQLLFMFAAVAIILVSLKQNRFNVSRAVVAGILLGMSLLVKPLMGGIGFGIAGLWMLATNKLDRRSFSLMSLVLVLMLVVGGSWHYYMYAEYGDVFLKTYFGGEVISRLEGEVNPKGWHFYPELWLATYWPWLPFFLAGISGMFICRKDLCKSERELLWFALIWVVVWGFILLVMPDKRARYALVVYPAAAIISAYGLLWLTSLWQFFQRHLLALLVIPLILLVTISLAPVRIQAGTDPRWDGLFSWMDQHGVKPRDLWEHGMYDGDTSRFYLRYKEWPRPAINRLTGELNKLPAKHLLLYVYEDIPPVIDVGKVLFQHDGLMLVQINE